MVAVGSSSSSDTNLVVAATTTVARQANNGAAAGLGLGRSGWRRVVESRESQKDGQD
jgi:hypothetical protein